MPKLYAIADLHLGHKINQETIRNLQVKPPGSGLILAGDLGESLTHLTTAFVKAKECFTHVFWVPGNHELYSMRPHGQSSSSDRGSEADHAFEQKRGEAKYQACVELAQRHGVLTPEDPWMVWDIGDGGGRAIIALCFTLYDYSFRPPEISRAQALEWAREKNIEAVDEALLFYEPYESRDAWCASLCDRWERQFREYSLALPDVPFVIVNHWPLREDVIYIPLVPRFTLWCGTKRTEGWHQGEVKTDGSKDDDEGQTNGVYGQRRHNKAKVVVTGHLHVRRTDYIDGVRFEEVSLGYPRQWQRARDLGKDVNDFLREILPGPAQPSHHGTVWRTLG